MYLGVDIGGTFTDLALMADDGSITTAKALTTPGQLENGVFDAIEVVAGMLGTTSTEILKSIRIFGHGTTQATNALIERTGAKTGLITTRGFGDTLKLQRLLGFTAGVPVDRLGWYSRRRYPDPLIPRNLVFEARERVDQAGAILLPLDEDDVRKSVKELCALGVDTFAVALLWAFRNPTHEQRIARIVHEIQPNAYVSLSSEVSPIIGEYERTVTTALNSYLAPKVANYLESIEAKLSHRGFAGQFHVLNSAGGVVPAHEAAKKPVLLVASGPAGGVTGSMQLAQEMGYKNVITTDMGGTSFDVALIVDSKPFVSNVNEVAGFHLNIPTIDIRAIGAGGGSIASVQNGLLRVGPESAGARPGPVCYGNGGNHATVTDADVVLGIISPEGFLGGRMKLDRDAAVSAIKDQIADPLGISVEQAAAGIRKVVDSHMADTLREVTIGRGFDPRDFVIFAYGGAGPAHCSGFGLELGVQKIVIPATSMAHSAYGALASDIHHSIEQSSIFRGGGGPKEPWDGLDAESIAEIFETLGRRAIASLEKSGIAKSDAEIVRSVAMRYRRQTNDLIISVPDGPIDASVVRWVVEQFEDTYEARYGKGAGFRLAGIEMTTFRVVAIGRTKKPSARITTTNQQTKFTARNIYEPETEQWIEAKVCQWLDLPSGGRVAGPAIIEHPETTVFVGSGQVSSLDARGNLSIEMGGSSS